jgi:hypothetical protein
MSLFLPPPHALEAQTPGALRVQRESGDRALALPRGLDDVGKAGGIKRIWKDWSKRNLAPPGRPNDQAGILRNNAVRDLEFGTRE